MAGEVLFAGPVKQVAGNFMLMIRAGRAGGAFVNQVGPIVAVIGQDDCAREGRGRQLPQKLFGVERNIEVVILRRLAGQG